MNNMTFDQAATVLNGIVSQMTGQTSTAAITTPEEFTAVAQTALKGGLDPVINAVAQLWGRTIFSYRDYTAKFDSYRMDLERFGNATRKLSIAAAGMQDDERFIWPVAYDAVNHPLDPLGNGQSVDQWKIQKPDVLQTLFYGQAVWEQTYTIFKDQFEASFRNAEELGRFNAMVVAERQNDRESFREAVARGLQANMIGAIIAENDAARNIHLITEYNAETGLSLDSQTVYQPGNFEGFIRWFYAKLTTIARRFGERSELYQTVINNKHILRHTPPERLRICLLAEAMDKINTMVRSITYHDDYLKDAKFEGCSFWQSITDPADININAVYTGTNGAVVQSGTATTSSVVFGIMHDLDAFGYSFVNEWTAVTNLNIVGGYWNNAWHSNLKTISDNSEKVVVFLLD